MRMRWLGTLGVHLKEAHNLIKMDWNGLSDPYVVVRLNGQMPAARVRFVTRSTQSGTRRLSLIASSGRCWGSR